MAAVGVLLAVGVVAGLAVAGRPAPPPPPPSLVVQAAVVPTPGSVESALPTPSPIIGDGSVLHFPVLAPRLPVNWPPMAPSPAARPSPSRHVFNWWAGGPGHFFRR